MAKLSTVGVWDEVALRVLFGKKSSLMGKFDLLA